MRRHLLAPAALFLCLPAFAQEPPKEQKADPKAVEAAIKGIDKAFTEGKGPERVAAIQAAAQVKDQEVARAIARGLRDNEREVKVAAVDALRFEAAPKAFEELESFWTNDRRLMEKDQDLAARVLKAIGQFGNPRAIELLAKNPFETPAYPAIKARLMGLANIRSKESLAKIIGMMQMVGLWTDQAYMDDVRLALLRLTGQDLGKDPNQWFMWYENNRSKIEIPKDPPQMNKLDQYMWDSYWSPKPLERPKDSETGGGEKKREGGN